MGTIPVTSSSSFRDKLAIIVKLAEERRAELVKKNNEACAHRKLNVEDILNRTPIQQALHSYLMSMSQNDLRKALTLMYSGRVDEELILEVQKRLPVDMEKEHLAGSLYGKIWLAKYLRHGIALADEMCMDIEREELQLLV